MASLPVFDGTNFNTWLSSFRAYVKAADPDLWKIISRGPHKLPKHKSKWNESHDLDFAENERAMKLIMTATDLAFHSCFQCCTSAKEIMKTLKRLGRLNEDERSNDCLTSKGSSHSSKQSSNHSEGDDDEVNLFDNFSVEDWANEYGKLLNSYEKLRCQNEKLKRNNASSESKSECRNCLKLKDFHDHCLSELSAHKKQIELLESEQQEGLCESKILAEKYEVIKSVNQGLRKNVEKLEKQVKDFEAERKSGASSDDQFLVKELIQNGKLEEENNFLKEQNKKLMVLNIVMGEKWISCERNKCPSIENSERLSALMRENEGLKEKNKMLLGCEKEKAARELKMERELEVLKNLNDALQKQILVCEEDLTNSELKISSLESIMKDSTKCMSRSDKGKEKMKSPSNADCTKKNLFTTFVCSSNIASCSEPITTTPTSVFQFKAQKTKQTKTVKNDKKIKKKGQKKKEKTVSARVLNSASSVKSSTCSHASSQHIRNHASRKSYVSCYYCGKHGHCMNDCYLMKKDDKLAEKSLSNHHDPKRKLSISNQHVICFNCNKRGHRAADCWFGSSWDNKDFRSKHLTCVHCGKHGHTVKDCWHAKGNHVISYSVNFSAVNFSAKRPMNLSCFNCGKIGHKSAECWWSKNKKQPVHAYPHKNHALNDMHQKNRKPVNSCRYCGKLGHSMDYCLLMEHDDYMARKFVSSPARANAGPKAAWVPAGSK